MNPSEITTLLKRTLDPSTRAEAEAGLKKGEKIIDFCPCLLQVIMDGSTEAPVRQAAAIYFKVSAGPNKSTWTSMNPTHEASGQIPEAALDHTIHFHWMVQTKDFFTWRA